MTFSQFISFFKYVGNILGLTVRCRFKAINTGSAVAHYNVSTSCNYCFYQAFLLLQFTAYNNSDETSFTVGNTVLVQSIVYNNQNVTKQFRASLYYNRP